MKNSNILNFNTYMIKESDEKEVKVPKEKILVPLYLSERLKAVLNKINTEPIAQQLLDTGRLSLPKFEISYLDIKDKDSKSASYFPSDRLDRIEINTTRVPHPDDPVWLSKLRQSMTWGRIINTLFPKQFTENDIERFYKRFRPEIDLTDKESERFKIVYGEDIRYWYLNSHWDGSLTSCMQEAKSQTYFDIYCKNPEKCGLLIYFSDTKPDKIIGRALVWNNLLKPSGDTADQSYTLLDRVYAIQNKFEQIQASFHKYAIDHKWIYKSGEQFLMNGQRKTSSVSTRLKPVEYNQYPYVDTMHYYTPETGRAASIPGNPARDPKTQKTFVRWSLRSQYGGKNSV